MNLADFLQSASNSAASNVSAPVDALAWLLKKSGVPIGEPVGGSDWMQRQGLTRPVKQSASSLMGETAGLLSPVVAAAKAPQIAKGLLQAGDNLAAPQMLNPQTGAIVWHGSPHKFDRFDAAHIGKGEGAQAYGHGLYFAENPKVAEAYQNAGIGNIDWENATYGGRKIQSLYDAAQRKQNVAHRMNDKNAIDKANAELYYWESLLTGTHPNIARSNALDPDAGWPTMQEFVKSIDDKKFKNINFPDTGLYKVDLPDEKIARMLDWDKPLKDNPQALRDVFNSAMTKDGYQSYVVDGQRVYLDLGEEATLKGRDAYRRLHEHAIRSGKAAPAAEKEAEMVRWLRNAGVPGVRYLDGGSRGAGSGSSNFVVFPGEESALRILERNGQGLLGP